MERRGMGTILVCIAATLALASAGQAIVVTQSSNASDLATAITGENTGIQVTGTSISGNAEQSGTFSNASLVYSKHGLDYGLVLSTGKVADFSDGPNTAPDWSTDFNSPASPAQDAILTTITAEQFHFDVVQLDINFTVNDGFDKLFFNMAFGSDEFPEWQGSVYEDGFGIFLNGTNIAFAGGLPVNISHPWVSALVGTELDGVMNAQFQGTPLLGGQENTLTFILGDASDGIYDTTVYLSALGAEQPPIPDDSETVPEPSGFAVLLVGGLSAAAFAMRRKR